MHQTAKEPLAPFRATPGPEWAQRHNLALAEPRGPEERRAVRFLRTIADSRHLSQAVLGPLIEAAQAYLIEASIGDLDPQSINAALLAIAEPEEVA